MFYTFFIPAVLIPMGGLALMDFARMMINRFRKGTNKPEDTHKEHKQVSSEEEARYD